jgi:predicted hotdog family 3-hydroxylacyl-ACP dehydratase
MNGRAWTPEELLPHRGPALLLRSIVAVSDTHCLASVHVEAGAWYLDGHGSAPAWLALEWMAQAASAFSGHRNLLAGGAPRLGFLLGARRFAASVPFFAVGTDLEVEAQAIYLDEAGLGAFRCEVRRRAEILAHATLKAIEIP